MAGIGRRNVALGLGLVAVATGWQIWGVDRDGVAFEPIPGAPGWRFAVAGEASGPGAEALLTIGLEKGATPLAPERLEAVVHRDGARLAVFGDFFCPYCRVLMGRIRAMNVDASWHELPLLGPNSVIAARAAEAAALQSGYLAFQDALMREGFRPSSDWMERVAEAAGLDGARLRRDMGGSQVAGRLEATASASARLGIHATPALAIDRRVLVGLPARGVLERLLS